jgi:diguanylate cyclase (GGDEF)-like protein/PAS domain S-box-containing protein
MAVKPKSASKKSRSEQNDLFHLAENIILNVGVGIYIVQHGKFVYVSKLYQKITGYSDTKFIGTYSLDHIYPDDREMVREQAIKRLKGKSSDAYEYRFIRKNNEVMWVLEMVTSIVYKGERATLGSFLDITERKRMEETLRSSEEKYRSILESIREGYFELDLDGNYTFANEANCRYLGYTKEELIGMNYRRHMDEENTKKLYNPYLELYRTGKPIDALELESIRKDGTKVIHETSVSLIRNSKGNPVGFRGVSRDVTARKKMEEALRQSAEKYRTILEDIDEGYFELDLTGNFTFVNNAGCMILGYSEKELIGMNNRNYTDKENAKKMFHAFNKLYRTGENVKELDYRIIKKNGTTVFTELSASLIKDSEGKPIGFRGLTRDINERKRAEATLHKSEEKYRTILENIEDGYYEVDLAGNFTFFNDSMCRILGYTKEELMGMNNRQFTDKENAKKLFKTFNEVYRTREPAKEFGWQIIRKDGTKRYIEVSVSLQKNSSGKPIGFRGISRDITERRQMEEMLRQSEEKYRTIIEEMEEWYFETTLAGNFLFFNDAFARTLGYSKNALTGLNFRAFIKNEDSDSIFKLFHQVYETCEPTKNFPYQYTRQDGIITFTELSIFPKRDQEGKVIGFRGVGHDITERKQTEQQLNYMATHDPLTGLPNRMLFIDRLKMALAQANRNSQKLAVMMLDLDHFKNVNDSLGHMVGDQLLKEIGLRLSDLLRQNDTIARLGGDEFIILLPEIGQVEDSAEAAGKILNAFQQPFICGSHKIISSTSIGIAIYPDDCQDTDSLLKNADMAMYYVKAHGRNSYKLFANTNFDQIA